jgi:succinoglycan biosynthesis protein ExoA
MTYVSIVVPCYNEMTRIRYLLDAIYAQTYPRTKMEVVIADGHSTDGTRETIADFRRSFPDLVLRVVDNNIRSIPAALNRAIEASKGDVILRLDAHSGPYPDYVSRCVEALEAGKGDNVGGVWEIHPSRENWIAESIAEAASYPLGVGDALYRHTKQPGSVDTVPFGCFRRELIERIGKFDETLLTNEDYEFNARIRRSGGTIWLDPSIKAVYFSRADLIELARQYWRYGYWKWRMLRRYPTTLRWRQGLPPLFVLSLVGGVVFSWLAIVRRLFLLEIIVYLFILILAGVHQAISKRKLCLVFGLPAAIGTMHLAWGSGFIWSMISGPIMSRNG